MHDFKLPKRYEVMDSITAAGRALEEFADHDANHRQSSHNAPDGLDLKTQSPKIAVPAT